MVGGALKGGTLGVATGMAVLFFRVRLCIVDFRFVFESPGQSRCLLSGELRSLSESEYAEMKKKENPVKSKEKFENAKVYVHLSAIIDSCGG